MSKSAIGASLLGMMTVTGFASLAQATTWNCPQPITKGGCPIVLAPQPGPQLPQEPGQ